MLSVTLKIGLMNTICLTYESNMDEEAFDEFTNDIKI